MRIYLFFALFFSVSSITHADEMINDLVAMVGEIPITILDLKAELVHNRPVNIKDPRNKESKILDDLIERAIVDIVMKEEVISISENQINEIIKKTMTDNGYKDEKSFELALIQQMHMSLEDYRREVTNNFKIQQISQLKVNVPAPKTEEIQKWYNQHRKEIGNKYLLRIIKKSFNPDNPKEELSVNQLMNKARGEAVVNFSQAALRYSDDPTASAGGLLGWFRLDELAGKDTMFANAVYQLGLGDVSTVFVSRGNYYIVKVDDLTPVTVDEASPLISQRLFQEKQRDAYFTWIKNKRKSTAIKIYMKDYQGL